MKRVWLAGSTAIVTLWSSSALAQEAASQANASTALGEIVVTAQRRTENLQKVPTAASALDADALKANAVVIQAHNPEQEEAEEEVEVTYQGDELDVGFNVNYLLDAFTAVDSSEIEFGLTDANSSALIRAPGSTGTKYVVMPMRL